MNISNVISPPISQTGLLNTVRPQAVDYFFTPSITTSASVVDISPLGNLLSAALIVGDGMLQFAATRPGGFSTVVAATQFFIDAFNSFLQNGANDLQSTSGGYLDAQLAQLLNAQITAIPDNAKSLIARLAALGINYQAPSDSNNAGQVTIDVKALQAAFKADPQGTSVLLAEMVQTIGQLAAKFTGLFTQMESLMQIGSSQSSLVSAALNGTLATTIATAKQLTATVSPVRKPLSIVSAPIASTRQSATTEQSSLVEMPNATTRATSKTPLALVTTPARTAIAPVTTIGKIAASVQPPVIRTPETATQEASKKSLVLVTTSIAIAPLAESTPPAATEISVLVTQPTVTGEPVVTVPAATSLSATIPVIAATALLTAARLLTATTQSLALVLPVTTTQATATTPLAATMAIAGTTPLPAIVALPVTALPTTTPFIPVSVQASPVKAMTVASAVALANSVNQLIDASNPAVAAAIAAYHLVDGIFDTGMSYGKGLSPAAVSYSEIWPVAKIKPVKL